MSKVHKEGILCPMCRQLFKTYVVEDASQANGVRRMTISKPLALFPMTAVDCSITFFNLIDNSNEEHAGTCEDANGNGDWIDTVLNE
jgi:hypothetical protein